MDAMSALAACVEAWGPAAVAVQLPRIWWALREELTEPSYPDGAEGGKGTAAAAAECLRRCLAARDSGHKQDGPPQQTLLKQVWKSCTSVHSMTCMVHVAGAMLGYLECCNAALKPMVRDAPQIDQAAQCA